ncbi:MAG: DUF1501 domain-containing protein [Planctomycetota bacterium]|nr:DUF1501 domain-containing protein [Planctomycetota bacterium]MDA1213636.1 DUF1501 domain-containing protein [Planctomycetota bacterium]
MLHRRDAMIRLGQVGLGALTLPHLLRQERAQAASRYAPHLIPTAGKAKSCILIYLWGGPPQMDMWDPNPEAPVGVRSLFSPIDTVVPGIQISEEMPLFAKHTDKTAIIRSYTHESNNHEPSVYRTLTGDIDNTLAVPRNNRTRKFFPNVQGVVSAFTPGQTMPATVTIPRPIGHDGSTYAGTHAGWLGAKYDPFEVAAAEETKEKPTHSMALPPELNSARLLARRGLLDIVEAYDRRFQSNPAALGMDSFREQAFSMLSSPQAKNAFDINVIDDDTRDRYGRNEWGESILMAKRLVESGVRLVTISWMYIQKSGNVANTWDNHGPFEGKTGYEMLKAVYGLPSLDRGFNAFMEDLTASGLLDETLIAMYGEFGRTPKINKASGRDHWGAVQSTVLAGGGIRGGQVYGSSDRDSAFPVSKPVSPEDMLATIYYAMGISPDSEIYDPLQRPHRIVNGTPLVDLFG